jgi:hypothetical protein
VPGSSGTSNNGAAYAAIHVGRHHPVDRGADCEGQPNVVLDSPPRRLRHAIRSLARSSDALPTHRARSVHTRRDRTRCRPVSLEFRTAA